MKPRARTPEELRELDEIMARYKLTMIIRAKADDRKESREPERKRARPKAAHDSQGLLL